MEDSKQCVKHQLKLDSLSTDISEIKVELIKITQLLHGNGAVGVAEMARRSFEHMNQLKASKNGLLDWTFRLVIAALLSFVALKVGLR